MKLHELSVGQTVKHNNGFIGEITSIKGSNVAIKVTDAGTSEYHIGYVYNALADYIDKVIEPKKSNTIKIEIATNLDEVNADLIDIQETLEEIAELQQEKTVFECDIQGVKFKGTKSDFSAFVDGMVFMAKTIGLK